MADDVDGAAGPQGGQQDGSTTQRRVYALPAEMVERIVEFQKEKGFQSEVEAVRRLLDEALKSRDTPNKIINRFLARLEVHRVASEAARDVLVGHPLVQGMRFTRDAVVVELTGAPKVTIHDDANVEFEARGMDAWSWAPNSRNKYGPGIINDGDVPF